MKRNFLIFMAVLAMITGAIIYYGMATRAKELENLQAEYQEKIRQEIETDASNLINFPKHIYQTTGKTTNVYYQNFLNQEAGNFQLKPAGNDAAVQFTEETLLLDNAETGEFDLKVELYNETDLVAKDSTTIQVNKMRTSPIKGLVLGDSTVNTKGKGYVTQRMADNLGKNLKLVGTMGKGTNKFEGRDGWTAAKYRTADKANKKANPFYNPAADDFDFSYYMSQIKERDLDVVIINLGINDALRFKSTSDMEKNLDELLSDYNHIIDSIEAYDPDIKIALNLPIPPNADAKVFAEEYDGAVSQEQVKENNFYLVQQLIETYGDSEKIDLIPIYLTIDTKHNFEDSVHPNKDGYNQIGDQITAYLNSVNK